jgi:hypothetical protein
MIAIQLPLVLIVPGNALELCGQNFSLFAGQLAGPGFFARPHRQ